MSQNEIDKFFKELKAWCREEPGRQKRLAKKLGVSEQRLSHWITGFRKPGLDHWLELNAFLRKQREKK
jgi:transcriptional regulator with XRE-family HTH domain